MSKPGAFASKHKYKFCEHVGCNTIPTYNFSGQTKAKFCKQHKQPNMINVKDKTCEYVGCNTQPTYNLPGQTKARFCSEHKQPNMVNVKDKKCGDLAMRWKKSRKKSTSVLPKTNFRLVARNLINTKNRPMSKSNVSKTVRKQTRIRPGVTIASFEIEIEVSIDPITILVAQ